MNLNKQECTKRIKEILNQPIEVLSRKEPAGKRHLGTNNANYYSVVSIFVDIRNSSAFLLNGDKKVSARILRSFSSEIIGIMKNTPLPMVEIGVRGDCVYSIFNAENNNNMGKMLESASNIIDLLEILNAQILEMRLNFNTVHAGIGIAKADTLVQKAGSDTFRSKALIWIGDSVTKASNLSNQSLKGNNFKVLVNSEFYNSLSATYKDAFMQFGENYGFKD